MKELSGAAQDAYDSLIEFIDELDLRNSTKEIVIDLIDILVEIIIKEKE